MSFGIIIKKKKKKKNMGKNATLLQDTESFIVYIKSENFYIDTGEDVERRFDA